MRYAVVRQRIDHGIHDDGKGRGCAAFSAGAHTERITRRQRFAQFRSEGRQKFCPRHSVVLQRARQELPDYGIIIRVFPQRLANALHNAAVGLAVQN
jgi:hypothetical protein